MASTRAFLHFLGLLLFLTVLPDETPAQDFIGTTINPGTSYDAQGLGVYDLTGGSLILDGSDVIGSGTTIQWTVPNSGGTLEFEANELTVTDGNLALTGNPIKLPPDFILSSGDSLEINSIPYNAQGGITISTTSSETVSWYTSDEALEKVLKNQGINYIPITNTGLTSYSSIPEPLAMTLIVSGFILLVMLKKRKLSFRRGARGG